MTLVEAFQFEHPPVQEGDTLHLTVKLIKKTPVGYKKNKGDIKNSGYLIEVNCLNPKLGEFEIRSRACFAESMMEGYIYDLPVRKPKDWLYSPEGSVRNQNNPVISNRLFQGVVNGYPVYKPSVKRIFIACEAGSESNHTL